MLNFGGGDVGFFFYHFPTPGKSHTTRKRINRVPVARCMSQGIAIKRLSPACLSYLGLMEVLFVEGKISPTLEDHPI